MKKILLIIMIVSVFMACEDVNDKHEKYLKEGSPVFAGKIDSLDCFSGFYRVKASIYPATDVNRKEFRIYWNNFNDSVVFPYESSMLNLDNGRYEVIIDAFQEEKVEGYITLTFRNYDLQGNRSREAESTVLIYGDDYASGLLNQKVIGFDGQFLNFAYRTGAVGLKVEYTTNEGTQKIVEFDETIEKLKVIGVEADLPDFKSGSVVKYKTLYQLDESDIDAIYAGNFSETDPIILPDPLILEEYEVHKYSFAETFNVGAKVYEGESFVSFSDQSWCTVTDNVELENIEISVEEFTSGSRTAIITVNVVGKTGAEFTKQLKVIQSDAIRLDHTKSGWNETGLPDENIGVWGWTLPHLWDGNNDGTGFHTETVTPPILFSVNFGKQLLIDGVEIVPRSEYIRNPEIFEVWASNILTEVGVDRDAENWEEKAVEAGWVKLKTVDFAGWKEADIRTAYVGATEKFQFMRIRVLKNSAGELAPLNLMEMSVIGKE